MNCIKRWIRNVVLPSRGDSGSASPTCKEYMDRIERLPDPSPNQVYGIDKCIQCLEKIPGILDPLEGYTLLNWPGAAASGLRSPRWAAIWENPLLTWRLAL